MKIFDCFSYWDEDLLLDLRLKILNNYVDYFVVVEDNKTWQNNKKNLRFDIKKFSKFQKKIIYIPVEDLPDGDDPYKRENHQRNCIAKGLINSKPDDLVIISDLDEIPSPSAISKFKIQMKYAVFKQKHYYYKLNLQSQNNPYWYGSRICVKKFLKSPQWLRNLKFKKRPFWRIDKLRLNNIIEDGGWHFSYLKTPKNIEKKLKSYLHHIDFDRNPLSVKKITEIIKNKKTIYNLKVDQKENKFDAKNDLVKIDIKALPKYINDNLNKFETWIEK